MSLRPVARFSLPASHRAGPPPPSGPGPGSGEGSREEGEGPGPEAPCGCAAGRGVAGRRHWRTVSGVVRAPAHTAAAGVGSFLGPGQGSEMRWERGLQEGRLWGRRRGKGKGWRPVPSRERLQGEVRRAAARSGPSGCTPGVSRWLWPVPRRGPEELQNPSPRGVWRAELLLLGGRASLSPWRRLRYASQPRGL